MGEVRVAGQVVTKPGQLVDEQAEINVTIKQQYVSRAALKLASVAETLKLDFRNKVVLDVGSSTGGFTDFALRHGASYVIAVEVGTDQLHPTLHNEPRIELHEQTDIRDVKELSKNVDIVLADVSFVSLRQILPSVAKLINKNTQLAIMVKPQFEARNSDLKHKGVIKNDRVRRDILKGFESWLTGKFTIRAKADSAVSGAKGNQERFYLLKKI